MVTPSTEYVRGGPGALMHTIGYALYLALAKPVRLHIRYCVHSVLAAVEETCRFLRLVSERRCTWSTIVRRPATCLYSRPVASNPGAGSLPRLGTVSDVRLGRRR
jgi:hypothetical protein